MPSSDPRLLLLHQDDNVVVLCTTISRGETLLLEGRSYTLANTIGTGHKLARRAIGSGEKVIKYGAPIGSATADIAAGTHVHLDNLESDYTPSYSLPPEPPFNDTDPGAAT